MSDHASKELLLSAGHDEAHEATYSDNIYEGKSIGNTAPRQPYRRARTSRYTVVTYSFLVVSLIANGFLLQQNSRLRQGPDLGRSRFSKSSESSTGDKRPCC